MSIFSIFQDPWLLAACAALPALYWLLRHQPPRPRAVAFPATWIVARIRRREETPKTTPWWLLLLRGAALTFVILGLAKPFLAAQATRPGDGPLVLMIDNDWIAAPDWDARMRLANRLIDEAEQRGAGVAVIASDPRPGEEVAAPDFAILTSEAARERLRTLAPEPWPADRAAFLKALSRARLPQGTELHWLWDGLGGSDVAAIAARLLPGNRLTVHRPPSGSLPPYIRAVEEEGDSLAITLGRLEWGAAQTATLDLGTADGDTVARQSVTFAPGERNATATLRLPAESFNRMERAEVAGNASAGGIYLFGEDWRRRRVGLAVEGENADAPSLTSPLYYIERALEPTTPLMKGPLDTLLADADAVILTDRVLTRDDVAKLRRFIENGGLVLRFAGDTLAAQPDGLTPMALRPGGRELGTTMTWDKPVPLGTFDAHSPFFGLAVPDDVRIERQILADPNALAGAEIWARLKDGTPLVTARHIGNGLLVMFQVGADPAYSTLPYSGLFVDMLQTVVKLSGRKVATDPAAGGSLAPQKVMDGHGVLQAAPPGLGTVPAADWAATTATPATPPGFYDGPSGGRALNLAGSKALSPMTPDAAWPAGTAVEVLNGSGGISLLPPFLLLGFILVLLDVAVSVLGKWGRRRLLPAAATALLLLAFFPVQPHAQAQAATAEDQEAPLDPEQFAVKAAGATHLAYVATPDPAADRLTDAGLKTLGRMLAQRTSVEPAEPMAIHLENEDISFFPILYWAVTPPYPRLSPEVVKKLDLFMNTGGLLVIDTGDGTPVRLGNADGPTDSEGRQSLAAFVGQFETEPMAPAAADHVLGRSFYLLDDMPGRWAGQKIWVSAKSNGNAVTPLIVTSSGWAAGWALDDHGDPMVPIIPGGRAQQEMAWRAGINLMMYALTGNYKSDQVHLPALLERLGQ